AKRMRKELSANLTQALLLAREAGLRSNAGRPDDFSELWNGLAETTVKLYISKFPREWRVECIKRGIKKMLRLRSYRLFAMYYLSLMHTGWFGLQGAPRKVREGDVGDFMHAIQASFANIFVTQESKQEAGKLGFILTQVPTPNFEVLNLQEFLQRI
ncbi:MAG: hypothetical protein LC746_07695, partial [Acidobacteria bacterium]|nr:hypothetical protein [Acidobacteriota bacterium]